MGLYSVDLAFSAAVAEPDLCPSCGEYGLVRVPASSDAADPCCYVCRSCRRRWTPQWGGLVPAQRSKDSGTDSGAGGRHRRSTPGRE